MERAPPEGREQQQYEHSPAGGGIVEQRGEAVRARLVRRGLDRLSVTAAHDCYAAARHREVRVGFVERALKEVLGVGAEAVRGVGDRGIRADGGALAGGGDDRLPPNAVGEGAVVERHAPWCLNGGTEGELQAGGREPARAVREAEPRPV